jgi:hypothetical protein
MRKEKINIYIFIMIISSLLLLLNCKPQKSSDGEKAQDWRTLITSDNEKERASAQQMVVDRRRQTIGYLLSVVNSPVKEGEEFYSSVTSRNIAIFLLGKLRAKEAVTELAEWLVPKPGQRQTIWELRMFSPAGCALVEIGLPSVPVLVGVIKSGGNSALREECIKIIVSIKGLRETDILFEDVVEKETDATKRENLKVAQDMMKDPKSREILWRVYKKINQLE